MIARRRAGWLAWRTPSVRTRRERDRTAQRLAGECHRVRRSSEFRVGIGARPLIPLPPAPLRAAASSVGRRRRPAPSCLQERVVAVAPWALLAPAGCAERVCGPLSLSTAPPSHRSSPHQLRLYQTRLGIRGLLVALILRDFISSTSTFG